MYSGESGFCLGASDRRMLIRRRPGERLKSSGLRRRDSGPTPGVMVWEQFPMTAEAFFVVISITLTAKLARIGCAAILDRYSRWHFPTS